MTIGADLRASVRYLRQRPLLLWLSVGTLGVGLGVASALFGIINALYLRPLPLDREKEVMVVRGVQAEQGLTSEPLSRHDMTDLLSGSGAVAAFGGLRDWGPALFAGDKPEPMRGIVATPGTFDVFRVWPHLGRLFGAADDVPGKNHVVLLTHRCWMRRFGGDRAIVGRALNLGGESFTIIGVLPERLTAPRFADAELWAPLSLDPDYGRGRGFRNLTVYARLAPGADRRVFGAELLGRARTLAVRFADDRGWAARPVPLIDHELAGVLPRLLLLGAAAVLLLLMACANMASLIFAESMARGGEYGLRAALGGSAGRLFRQLFTDQLLLCLAGGGSAVAIAWTLLAFTGRFAAVDVPRLAEIRPDGAVVVFAFGASVLLALLFTAISVWWALRGEPAEHIRITERSVTHAAPRWISHALVASQVALAFVLLWSGLSFTGVYRRLATASPGFDTRGLLLLRVEAVDKMKRKALVARSIGAVDDLQLMPGVASATIASSGPLFGSSEEVQVAAESTGAQPLMGSYANVDAGFFDCLRIPIVAGQRFTRANDGRGKPVAVISRSLAARLFPRGDAVGKELLVGPDRYRHTIIGIAGDADEARVAHGGIDVYVPFAQDARRRFYVVVRGATLDAVTARLHHSLPGFMVTETRTMSATIEEHLLAPRLQAALLILFAAGAAILAAVAVFGMVTLVASNRAGEMGLRLALGATPRQTQLLLLRAVAWPVVIAVAAGATLVTAGRPQLQPLLAGLSGAGPLPAALAASVIAALTVAASWRNMRALSRQEPMASLRAM